MEIKVKIIGVMLMLVSSISAFKIEVSGIDEWGLHGVSKDAIVVPSTDYDQGGSSKVLDPSGLIVGPCPQNDVNCTSQWNLSNTFVEKDWAVNHISSKLQITDFVPSSKSGWGWAQAGWWVIPNYDATLSGATAFDKAKPAGLTDVSWFSAELSYTAGQTLTIELKGDDIDKYNISESPPRFSYEGRGSFEIIEFPIAAIKRAGWSSPATYDVSKVNGFGFLRMEAALASGAQFPSSAMLTTDLKIRCFAMGSSKGDNGCTGGGVDASSAVLSSSSLSSHNSSSYIYSSISTVSSSSYYNPLNFKIEASNLDEWGLHGNSKDAIIVPDADVFEGGTSGVFDPAGKVVGGCPNNDLTCTPNWNISGTFVEQDWRITHFSSKLKITDFIPNTKASWGWAYAGWWVVPNYDATASGETAFDKAHTIGLTGDSWLSMAISYTQGERLTLQLKGLDINEDDLLQSPPRYYYEGKGYIEVFNLPVKAIKRAGWSVPASYVAGKVTSVGFLRREVALAEGAAFPSSTPENTEFKFICLSSGRFKDDNLCVDNVTVKEIIKIGYLGDLTKRYMFEEFNFYLPYYLSGNPISYSTKSLLGKTNPRISSSYLYVNSLSNKTGVDLIEVTASNNTSTVKDTFMVTISNPVLPSLDNEFSNITKKENFNSFNLSGADYFSGGGVNYSLKSLHSKLNMYTSGSTLYFSSKDDISGLDTVIVTATNSVGSVSDTFEINILKAEPPIMIKAIENMLFYHGETDSVLELSDYFSSTLPMSFFISEVGFGSGLLPIVVGSKLYVMKEFNDFITYDFEIKVSNQDGFITSRFSVGRLDKVNAVVLNPQKSQVGEWVKVYSIEGQEIWSGIWTETPILIPGNYIVKSKTQIFRYSIK